MKNYPALLAAIYNTPHCIQLDKLHEIAALVERRELGTSASFEAPAEPKSYCLDSAGEQFALDKTTATRAKNSFVAVMPLFGTMYQHGGMEMQASGGTSTETFAGQFRSLVANPAVRSIVLETHSPGGQVFGTQELSDLIYAARDSGTRIVAAVNSQAASAALWTSTSAEEVYVTPGGEMGSIGTVCIHRDYSGYEEKEGVKTTVIASPSRKVEGHPYAPLEGEAAERLLAECAKTTERFQAAVGRNRGVGSAEVASKFGGGGMLSAEECVAVGLADGIATKADVLGAEVQRLRLAGGGNARLNSALLDSAEIA